MSGKWFRLLLLTLPTVLGGAAPFLAPRVVPLGAPEKFQYVVIDPPSHRIFVAHGTEVTVVDSDNLAVIGHVSGLSGAHGIALVPGGHGFADSGKARTVTVFDSISLQTIATLRADDDAYAVIYDPASRHVFVMNDDAGNITVIDPKTDKVITTIVLTPGFESAEADGRGHLFIAHSQAHQVLRIDTARNLADAAWEVPNCGEPHGLALDQAGNRLFVTCPEGRFAALNAKDGHLVANLPIGKGADVLLFDAKRHRLYSPNADATLTVIQQRGPDAYVAQADVSTPPGARTGALDPATGRLFLVTAKVAQTDPPKHPGGAPRFRFVPGSTMLLVYDPTA